MTGASPEFATTDVLSTGRNATKARVLAVDWQGVAAVEKNYSQGPLLMRLLLGPLLLSREERALRRLEGTAGFPRVLARPDRTRLVMTHLPGTTLRDWLHRGATLPPRFFERLDHLLTGMHGEGVAQGDIGLGDVLVLPDGEPALVDFSVSVVRGRGPLGRLLFGFAAAQDNRRFERLRQRFRPAAESRDGAGRSLWLGRLRLGGLFGLFAFWAWNGQSIPVEFWIGLPLVIAGSLTRIWSAGYLLKTRDLAVSGPYAHCQHPLYLGRLLLFSGFAVMARLPYGGHLVILGAGLLVFFAYYLPRKVRVEGARLEREHGRAYVDYRRAVPVLFPSPRPWRGAGRAGRWQLARFLRNREAMMVILEAVLVAIFAWRALG